MVIPSRKDALILNRILSLNSIEGIYSFQGYLVNWDIQKTIWDYIYGKEELNFDFANQKVVLTEPYFNFQPIQEGLAEVFFEDLECEALYKTNRKSSVSRIKF